MLDILMLIKTSKLEFDDRLRKEIITISNFDKTVAIRAILQNNFSGKGQIFENNSFKTYRLITRDILPQRRLLAVKAIEMYFYFVLAILRLRPNVVWVHNFEMIGLLPVLHILRKINFIKKIVWDQHELPPEQYFHVTELRNKLQKAYYKCDTVIAANESRQKLLLDNFKIAKSNVILNLPHSSFGRTEKKELDNKYKQLSNNRQYFITTGLMDDQMRYILNISEAILKFEEYCLFVMGPYSQRIIQQIEKFTYGKPNDSVFFTGMINQDEIINLTDNAFASIVFYNIDKLNNKYCAPNRLYQAIARGVPVITGNNPPLADFVNKHKIGYVLNSDGRNTEEIVNSINQMKLNRDKYIQEISKIENLYDWDANISTIRSICNI